MDLDLVIRKVLKLMLRQAEQSRGLSMEQIADEISGLVGRRINATTLYAWIGESRTAWKVPADCLAPICHVTKSAAILELILSSLQKSTAGPEEQKFCDLGQQMIRFELEKKEVERQVSQFVKEA
jgi:hypothetical protein